MHSSTTAFALIRETQSTYIQEYRKDCFDSTTGQDRATHPPPRGYHDSLWFSKVDWHSGHLQ